MINKRMLTTAVAVAAIAAPANAGATLYLENGSAGTAPAASGQAAAGAAPSSAAAVPAASAGFQWDDAALGAAGTLVLVVIGSGTAFALRRRTGPLAG